jgi:cyclic pyranopterin phosphate synthase
MPRVRLSHLDARGRARMVDVSDKPVTARRAVAEGEVALSPAALRLARSGRGRKGDVFETARLAGIAAAKRTAELVPLCHPLRLDVVDVEVVPHGRDRVRLRAEVAARERTGVEMEALTAVAVAALTVYDMVKAADRAASVVGLRVVEKEGGRSGPWRRPARRRRARRRG